MKLFADILTSITQFIQKHEVSSGLVSVTGIGLGSGIVNTIGAVLKYGSLIVGITVGLITIYSFMERKGLLPKWLQLPDKKK